MKFKYLRVQDKATKVVVKRMDVAHLNKKGREAEWDKLDIEYPKEKFITCYEQSERELQIFTRDDS